MTRWSSWLATVLGLGSAAKKSDRANDGDEQPPADAVASDMKEMRDHLRRVGAALGVAGGTLLSGLGYTQVHKIFPLPNDSSCWLLVLALAASTAALVGAATLAGRFYGAQRRIPVSTDPDRGSRFVRSPQGLRWRERQIRNRIYEQAARDETAQSLKAVELRAYRYERLARRGNKDKAGARVKESKRLLSAVDTTLGQGAAAVLERRAHQAFNGSLTKLALLVTIAGIIGVFGLADWSQGQRDLVALGKTCVEAKKAVPACKRFGASAQTESAASQSGWLNSFRTTVLKRKLVAFRVYGGGSGRLGMWSTTIPPANAARARALLALPEQNRARCIVRVEIPRGTTVRIGHVGPLFNQPGGAPQVQIPGSLKKIVFKRDRPLPPSKRPCP